MLYFCLIIIIIRVALLGKRPCQNCSFNISSWHSMMKFWHKIMRLLWSLRMIPLAKLQPLTKCIPITIFIRVSFSMMIIDDEWPIKTGIKASHWERLTCWYWLSWPLKTKFCSQSTSWDTANADKMSRSKAHKIEAYTLRKWFIELGCWMMTT